MKVIYDRLTKVDFSLSRVRHLSRALATITAMAAVFTLIACAETADISPTTRGGANGGSALVKPSFTQFPDIPVPSGTKIIVSKTLVFGTKPWFGQLALSSSSSANTVFDFYRANLTGYGWQELTSVRAPTSILTYIRDNRVLAIAIQSATIHGADITITVSPRGDMSGNTGAPSNPQVLPAPPARGLNLNQ